MPYVSPIVGYFGRRTTTGNLRAYGVCAARARTSQEG